PAGSVLVLRDRTEGRQFQLALAESEQHYRTLANSGTALIWASDTEKLCTYFNEPWLRFTGRAMEEELGYGWAEGVHPEDLDRCIAIYTEAFDRREQFVMEYRLMHASGEYRWIVDYGAPRYNTQGEFLGYIGFCLDISERREAEAALRESEERFRTLADSAPEGIFIQIEGRFAYINEAATRLFGARSADELLHAHVAELFHPSCREQVRQRIDTLNREQKHVPPAEEVILRLDGTSLDVEVAAVPFSLAGRNGALVFFHEIGSLKRAAEAMRRAKEAAESANLAKSEFLANMSHEIRTPLNGVLGMLQLLGATSLTPEQQEYVTTAIQSSRRLTRLLADILDLSRIESGKLTLQAAPFEVAALEESVLGLFALPASEKGVALEYHMASTLPEVLVGDETRLRQILVNLVGNAVKFTDAGQVRLEAFPLPSLADTGQEALRVLFCVSDTGIGMDEQLLRVVFEPFSQAEAAYARRFQGAGLGLSIVRKLVRLMGGELCLDSAPGQGTTAYLVLSFARQPAASARQARPGSAADSHDGPHDDPPRVLFVEDDEVNSLAGIKLLEKLGYVTTPAMNGQEALDLLEEHPFDIILMDVQMPVKDGLTAAREIRTEARFRQYSRIPIIAMTAYAMAGDRDRFLGAGMDGYISKPMDVETLVESIETALQQAGWPPRNGRRGMVEMSPRVTG
ncbi:MAG: PAS domain S-box protein, partial [Desulfovibrio sp.]|nr:PAS domain S-box protein [Desulfovibrio sp.]